MSNSPISVPPIDLGGNLGNPPLPSAPRAVEPTGSIAVPRHLMESAHEALLALQAGATLPQEVLNRLEERVGYLISTGTELPPEEVALPSKGVKFLVALKLYRPGDVGDWHIVDPSIPGDMRLDNPRLPAWRDVGGRRVGTYATYTTATDTSTVRQPDICVRCLHKAVRLRYVELVEAGG